MSTPHYDVVIAGAGPAGSSLAIELASSGMHVLLSDAAHFPRDKPCGDFVSPRGLKSLADLGCEEQIQDLGCQPIRSSRLYLNRELLVAGDIPRVDGLPDFGHAVPRKTLDEVLFRRAIEAGANSLEGCAINNFSAAANGITINAVRDGKPCSLNAALLVGADGANSAVAKAAGQAMNDARYTLASLRAYAHGLTVPHTLMYFDERFFPGYGWVFPVREGLCNIGVGMVKEPIVRDQLSLREFYRHFCALVSRFARERDMTIEIGPHQGWPIRTYGGAKQNYFPRGLLIGEAACFVDPINGEGIPMAFDSARLAARVINNAFSAGDFSPSMLASYEQDWRQAFDPDLGISDLVAAMIRNRDLLALWLSMFRAMSLTAREDQHYAAVTGGVLAGVVSARDAITVEMFFRAIAQSPKFWREMLLGGPPPSIQAMLKRGSDLLRWQAGLTQNLLGADPRARDWLNEIVRKQRRLVSPGYSE